MGSSWPIQNSRIRIKADIKFQVKHIGKPFVTNSKPVYFEKQFREKLHYSSYTDHMLTKLEKYIMEAPVKAKLTDYVN